MKAVLQILSFTTLMLLASVLGFSQSSAEYSVRFELDNVDCENEIIQLRLEVKANENTPPFNISDQNYRFSFDDNVVINPRIVQELEISGDQFGNEFFAFFDPHHLNGSIDTIVSYNVVLGGGTGYPVDDTRWYPVGLLAFDIIDMEACMELKWHTQAPEDFPPTFVGEKIGGANGTLFSVTEGTYDNGGIQEEAKDGDIVCFLDACPLPIEMASFEAFDKGCSSELYWTTATETNNEFFEIEKSDNGVEWRTIGKIDGSGTTTEEQTYKFVDKNITNIVAYYRIRQIDFSGESQVSLSISVRSSCYNDEISIGITDIFPNPVKNDDRVNIEFYTERGDSEARLIVSDGLGRIVLDQTQELREGPNTLSFKAGSLAAGVYFVQIKGDNWYSSVQKFVKVISK